MVCLTEAAAWRHEWGSLSVNPAAEDEQCWET